MDLYKFELVLSHDSPVWRELLPVLSRRDVQVLSITSKAMNKLSSYSFDRLRNADSKLNMATWNFGGPWVCTTCDVG